MLLVSIIVPVFNVEQYLPECIESIRKQTYKNIEVILVDDGSTDSSGEICDNYAMADKRIKVIHQHNGGVVAARKSGLRAAQGEYVGFVDGDDYIDSCMYQNLLEEILASGADLVHSGYWEDNGKKVSYKGKAVSLAGNRVEFIRKAIYGLEEYITSSMWSKLYQVDFIKRIFAQVPDDCCYGEDSICLYISILECRKIALVDAAYYHYRTREGSLSHVKGFDHLRKACILHEWLREILLRYGIYDDLKDILDRDFWGRLLGEARSITSCCFQLARYYFQDVDALEGKRIVIYGAGAVGRDYYAQISRYTDCAIAAWVDSSPGKYDYPHIKLYGPEVLEDLEFDLLLIAVKGEETASAISEQLLSRGICGEKILWAEPKMYGLEDSAV